MMKKFIVTLLLMVSLAANAQTVPGLHWKKYKNVGEVGFSETKLAEIGKLHTDMNGGALMIVYNGAVVFSNGDVTRKYMDHSMRKSYLSALFGIHYGKGEIDMAETLEDLRIDDIQSLSKDEKQATVADLLSARSGVYHPAAYSPRGMSEQLPERGSHAHGTFWYYNNWDFNTLSTLFKQKTNLDVFDAFKNEIANAIGMEDFNLSDTFYRYEDLSQHPAYLFRLSARDEARFGLLYANNGAWNGKQIIPKEWIEKSTSAISQDLTGFNSREGYGYLWWTTSVGAHTGYYASGSGGQRIAIFPSRKLVIVQSTDTYDGSKNIPDSKIDELIEVILNAQTEKIVSKPKLEEMEATAFEYPDYKIDMGVAKQYIGAYSHRFLGVMSVAFENNEWILKTGTGNYRLHPLSDNEFIPEDIQVRLIMEKSSNASDKGKIQTFTNPDRSLASVHFLY